MEETKTHRPRFVLYHANSKGTGCAVKMDLHPAHDFSDGCLMAKFARQTSVGGRVDGVEHFPRFDWENAITVKLDFTDLSKMLQVFLGECESIEDGKGIFHRSQKATTKIMMRHIVEPVQGYSIEVYKSPTNGDGQESSARIMLYNNEALGLTRAIEGIMPLVCFGIPMVIPKEALVG